MLLAFAHSFWMAAASQVVWGIFATFQSGADVAWLTDEVGEEAARPLYLRGDQFWHAAAFAGIVAGVALATIDLALPILVAGAGLVVLAGALWIVMPEEGFERRARREGERLHHSLIATFREGVTAMRSHPALVLILCTAALHGASTEGFDRLSDLHILRDIGLPAIGQLSQLWWFAILDGGALVIGFAALIVVRRRVTLEGHVPVARVLAAIDVLLVLSVVVFALTGQFWVALAAMWVVGALRSVRDPVFTVWINQGLDPKTRATINSVGGQADAVGQAAGGPVLGAIAGGIGGSGRHRRVGRATASDPAAVPSRHPSWDGGHARAGGDRARARPGGRTGVTPAKEVARRGTQDPVDEGDARAGRRSCVAALGPPAVDRRGDLA